MNRFISLDQIFPCGKDRKSGEVVGINLQLNGVTSEPLFFHWKRKAWYVNASVNAFHMHRGMCREIKSVTSSLMSRSVQRELCRTVGDMIEFSYRSNAKTDRQSFSYAVHINMLGCWEDLDAPNPFLAAHWELVPFSFKLG